MVERLEASYLNYFGDNYRWSHGLLLALGSAPYGGGDVGEIHHVGLALRDADGDDQAWFEAWRDAARRAEADAERHEAEGRLLTAASAALRACSYYQVGERFKTHKDDEALEAYSRSLTCFQTWIRHGTGPKIETVEVPYEQGSLPAYLVHPRVVLGDRAPCVVFFDGLDITKELQYLRGVRELSDRGVACLVIDGPGNGESIRFRGYPLRYDYDVAGTATVDWLETRDDIDPARIGVMGISLGGYYAPRCAAFEPRFAACVAYGAIWDYHRKWKERLDAAFSIPMSVAGEHIAWTFGVDTPEQALELLVDWKLEGVAKRIACPTLVVHGEDDQQVSLADAQALFDEIGAEDKTLRIHTNDRPGAQHCQIDSPSPAFQEIADWFATRLGGIT